jgi:hypothetical protein
VEAVPRKSAKRLAALRQANTLRRLSLCICSMGRVSDRLGAALHVDASLTRLPLRDPSDARGRAENGDVQLDALFVRSQRTSCALERVVVRHPQMAPASWRSLSAHCRRLGTLRGLTPGLLPHSLGKKPANRQSGRRDSNSGPLVPQTSALTRLRHAPRLRHLTDFPRTFQTPRAATTAARRGGGTGGRSARASSRACP